MSKMQWFRLYHRIIDDEKIRLLAFEDRWHFVAICCLKADGLLDEPDEPIKWRKIAVKLGVQLRDLDEVRRRLFEVGLIDENMQPEAWGDLQYQGDSSTDRVRKFREKRHKNNDETHGNVPETKRNVSETVPDTDTDTEIEEPNGSLSETSSDEVRKPKKSTSYPEQFEAFWRDYPRTANMSKKEAFDAWRKLSEEDRAACHQAIPGYIAFLKTKPDLETIHACRFISKRRFDGFVNHSPPSIADDDRWLKRLKYARQHQTWSQREWGPPPGAPGCLVPRHLLEPCDGVGWSEWQQQAA